LCVLWEFSLLDILIRSSLLPSLWQWPFPWVSHIALSSSYSTHLPEQYCIFIHVFNDSILSKDSNAVSPVHLVASLHSPIICDLVNLFPCMSHTHLKQHAIYTLHTLSTCIPHMLSISGNRITSCMLFKPKILKTFQRIPGHKSTQPHMQSITEACLVLPPKNML
jgi:hypothetical protein